jgi:3-hydroxyisobutyrate dehydrogenase-like beta-hydroxyacid dehydrogenase
MPEKPSIGFIGLGSLGAPIAENILEQGYGLTVYNRTSSKSIPLKERGATVAENIAGLAARSEIIFSIVSDDAALKSVITAKDGLLSGMKPGTLHICMSTILPKTAVEMHYLHQSRSTHYLAAPVFGRPEAARARKLNFAISGEEKIRNSSVQILKDAGAANIWDFGESVNAANTVKLCGNYMIGAAIQAMGEGISLARQSGIDARKMWEMFTQTLFAAPIYVNYGKIILEEKFEPAAFSAKLGLKDLNLVIDQASSVNQRMPLAQLLRDNLQELVSTGREQLDWSAIFLGAQKN